MLIIGPGVVGLIVLSGWLFDLDGAERVWLASPRLQPSGATGFVGLTAAMLLLRADGRIARLASTLLPALVASVGMLRLLDSYGWLHLPFGAVIFASKLDGGPQHPSRFAPNAAACFLSLGLAILALRSRWTGSTVLAQALALLAATIALFALAGYLYVLEPLYVLPDSIPMALPSTLCVLSLSSAIAGLTYPSGLLAPVTDKGAAGQSARILLPAALLVPPALGGLWLAGERLGLFRIGEAGVEVLVILTALLMATIIWLHSRRLLDVDRRRVLAEAELQRVATHDHLTSLPNRACFMAQLTSRLAMRRRRADDCFAVLYMDIDGLKRVNDQLGHEAGDRLLQRVAAHLSHCARADDLVARLGGDEFTMLLPRIGLPQDAGLVAARILDGMPTAWGPPDREIPVGISIGIAVGDHRPMTADAMLVEADQALYAAKRGGRGRVEFFTPAAPEATDTVRFAKDAGAQPIF